MNKKSTELRRISSVIYQEDSITVYKEFDGNYFEIGEYFTHDVLEAVAILMRNPKWSKLKIWDYAFEIKNSNPINVIYWLSGGDTFWKNPELNKGWTEVLHDIMNKFENRVIEAGKNTKLTDIRKHFKNHLNLDSFYEFALSKEIL